MLNEMLKIATPAVLKAKQIICYQNKQSQVKVKQKPFDILNKKFKNRLRGLTVSRPEKNSLIFDFCSFPDNTDKTCEHNATSKQQSIAVVHQGINSRDIQMFCSSFMVVCVSGMLVHVLCRCHDCVCSESVSHSLRPAGVCQAHRGGQHQSVCV